MIAIIAVRMVMYSAEAVIDKMSGYYKQYGGYKKPVLIRMPNLLGK